MREREREKKIDDHLSIITIINNGKEYFFEKIPEERIEKTKIIIDMIEDHFII